MFCLNNDEWRMLWIFLAFIGAADRFYNYTKMEQKLCLYKN